MSQRPGRPSCLSGRPEKHKLGRGHLSTFFKFRSAISEEKSKMSQPIRGQGGHLIFLIDPKHKLGRGRLDLASCQVMLNSVQRLQGSWKRIGQSEARAAILFFRSTPKNTNLVEEVESLLPVKFRSILLSSFQRRSRKCEKLTTSDNACFGPGALKWWGIQVILYPYKAVFLNISCVLINELKNLMNQSHIVIESWASWTADSSRWFESWLYRTLWISTSDNKNIICLKCTSFANSACWVRLRIKTRLVFET